MSQPLVSILVPAYNERFFGEALASALAQTYATTEIVVCDDSAGGAIEAVVRSAGDGRIRYRRNATRLGFHGNFTQCLALARGEYVKFLNDDDRLLPECVERLAGILASQPAVALATSRRRVIDAAGRPLADTFNTTPVSHVPALFVGRELGDFALVNSANFIGEPSTVLFRRAAVVPEGGSLFRWGGREYHCLADLSLWLRLLANGLAYYAAAALSEYRMHAGQEQRGGEVAVGCLVERLWLVRQARTVGYLAAPAQHAAALQAIDQRARKWLEAGSPSAEERSKVEGLLAEIAAERPR